MASDQYGLNLRRNNGPVSSPFHSLHHIFRKSPGFSRTFFPAGSGFADLTGHPPAHPGRNHAVIRQTYYSLNRIGQLCLTPERCLTDHTMIREFFINLVNRAKKAAHAIRVQCNALSHRLLLSVPRKKFPVPVIFPETGEAMTTGKRYRLTSDHVPVFSPFTFFPDRQ